jgi:hypothetical protein
MNVGLKKLQFEFCWVVLIELLSQQSAYQYFEAQESISEYLLSHECYCINVNFEIICCYTKCCINRFKS